MKKSKIFVYLIVFGICPLSSVLSASAQFAAPSIQGVRQTEPTQNIIGVPGTAPRTFRSVRQGEALANQDPSSQLVPPGVYQLPKATPFDSTAPMTQQGFYSDTFFSSRQHSTLQAGVNAKLAEYRGTKESGKKKELENDIRELLSQQFDERLKGPEQRIKASRDRLEELKTQVKNRAGNQDEIVDLRLKVLTNESIGLGWSSPKTHASSFMNTYQNPYQAVYDKANGQSFFYNTNQPQNISGYRVVPGSAPESVGAHPIDPAVFPTNANRLPKEPKNDKPTVGQLLQDYKAAKENSERTPITKELRKLLTEEFQKHQELLTNSATRIEKMIADLEKNVAERKKLKDSIVDLKLKTLINQANGLGF